MARTRNETIKARVDGPTKSRLRKLAKRTIGGESAVIRKAISHYVASEQGRETARKCRKEGK